MRNTYKNAVFLICGTAWHSLSKVCDIHLYTSVLFLADLLLHASVHALGVCFGAVKINSNRSTLVSGNKCNVQYRQHNKEIIPGQYYAVLPLKGLRGKLGFFSKQCM